jgi:iron complex outermembrane receptor protein
LEVPGANITRTGGVGSFSAISLRGANPDEVRVYIDGVPINQAVGGAVDLSTLPLGDVERVEVYRGSTPMAFGQSALGGVVSISTRTPAGARATVRAGAGSFRTMSSDVTAGQGVGRLRLYGGFHVLRAMGAFPDAPPMVPGGYQPSTRENSDLSQSDGVLRAALPLGGRRELRAGFIGITRDQGLPAENIFRSDARAATTRLLAHVAYESRDDLGASSRLRAAAFASATWDSFLDREHQIVGIPTATHDRSRLAGGTVMGEKAVGDWARVSTLLEGRAEDYLPRNDLNPGMPVGFPARRSVGTAGIEVDSHSAWLDLDVIPSVRLEASRDIRTGRGPVGNDLPQTQPIDRLLPILRLGWLRPVGAGVSLRGNVGRYARIPSFVELYGNNRGFIGSPGLRPEQGVNADVGISATRPNSVGTLAMSATVFGSRVDDLIAWETYSAGTRAQNVSQARIWGVETELRFRGRQLMVTSQATFTDARDRGDIASRRDRQLEHHPRYRGYARGEWRQPLGATAFALSGYADADGTAGNFQTTGPYSAIPARLLLGAGLGLEHTRAGLRLAASAFNLADSRVADFSGYPLPGRSFYVALGWSSEANTPAR